MKKNGMKKLLAVVMAAVFLSPMAAYASRTVGDALKDTVFIKSAGQSVEMTSYDANNKKHTYNGTASNFDVRIIDDGVLDNDWFTAFCVDPFQGAKTGTNINVAVELVAPSKVFGGLQAAWLFENYYKKENGIIAPSVVTALQVAIWEAVVDYDKDYDLKTGDYSVSKINGKALSDTNTTWSLATAMIADLQQNFSSAGLDSSYKFARHGNYQDFIINYPTDDPIANPEPGTMILMGIGVLGLVGFRKMRKK